MRSLAAVCAFLLVFTACTGTTRAFPAGFRKLEKGSVISYRVEISQTRTASGLGPRKSFTSTIAFGIEEEAIHSYSYALVVRSVGARDGRALDADGAGTMSLSGAIPDLPGRAANLSGKTLHLDTSWTIHRRHVSPFPVQHAASRSLPLAVASGLVALAIAAAAIDAFRRRA